METGIKLHIWVSTSINVTQILGKNVFSLHGSLHGLLNIKFIKIYGSEEEGGRKKKGGWRSARRRGHFSIVILEYLQEEKDGRVWGQSA